MSEDQIIQTKGFFFPDKEDEKVIWESKMRFKSLLFVNLRCLECYSDVQISPWVFLSAYPSRKCFLLRWVWCQYFENGAVVCDRPAAKHIIGNPFPLPHHKELSFYGMGQTISLESP